MPSTPLTFAVALLILAPLSACNGPQQPNASGTTNFQSKPTTAPTASPVATPAPAPSASNTPVADDSAAPRSAAKQCRFEVDGKTLLDGRCQVYPMGDGGYTLNSWSEGKPAASHFAVVTARGDGKADASWNADPNDDRAGDPLGVVALRDGCWVNDRTRICAK